MATVHLIERVRNPAEVYSKIRARLTSECTVIDFSSGRVGAVSALEPDTLPGSPECRWIRASDYEHSLADGTRQEFVRMTHEIGSTVISQGRNAKECLAYDGEFSLWWLSDTSEKHAINHPLRWFVYCCEIIKHLIDSEDIEEGLEWNIWASDAIVAEMYAETIGSRGNIVVCDPIQDDPQLGHAVPLRRIKSTVYISYVIMRAIWLGFLKRVSRLVGRYNLDSSREHVIIISISDTGWKKVVNPDDHPSGIQEFDSYMGYMPWDIKSINTDVSWLRNTIAPKEFWRWRDKISGINGIHDVSSHAVLGVGAAWRVFANAQRLIGAYNNIIANKERDIWIYNGISLDALVERDLRRLCERGVNFMVKFEQYRRAIETIRPTAVLYKSEMFIPGRLISAAMKARTRLVALQHGIHISEALVYQFDPRDIDNSEKPDHIRYCPMPDVFAAFGEYAREQFVEWGGYDAAKVFPMGGVRHDHLVRTLHPEPGDRRVLNARLRARLKLPVEGHIVLLCTQQKKDVGKWFDLVIQSLESSRPEAFVAIQLHHAHGGAEHIHAVASQRKFYNYRILKDATYPAIACSDVVVTGPSTIVLEAILLDTPAVTIAGSGAYETYPYGRERLAVTVSTAEEMAAAFQKLLADGASAIRTPRRSELLRRHLWNDDASACERLLKLIRSSDFPFQRVVATTPTVATSGDEQESPTILTVHRDPEEAPASPPG